MTIELSLPAARLTQLLCDIPSVSGQEGPLADAIHTALEPLAHLTLLRHGNTVAARTELGRERRVVIAGHIDTVPVNGNLPVRLIEEDGQAQLWGRGTVDMKAGVAVQLHLAAELTAPAVDVTWIWYDNEEVSADLNGLGLLAAAHPELFSCDFAILGEPTGAVIEGGCNGTLRATIRTSGVRAHSARAWMGENAIHAAGGILRILEEHRAATVTVDGLDYREGLSAVFIRGGVAGNVIPDVCEVEVNYRFAPDKTVAQAEAVLRRLFDGFEVEVTDAAPGARPGLDDPFAAGFAAAVGAPVQPKYGWTDVARFAELGVPAVNYGPGDPSLAHHDHERVPVREIEAVERGLRAWLTSD